MKFFIPLLLFISFAAHAQTVYHGKVIDSKTLLPLPFVNIGIVGKGVGTVTDKNGRFKLLLEEKYNADTLRISMLGYTAKSFTVAHAKQHLADSLFRLEEVDMKLNQVDVQSKRLKRKILGSQAAAGVVATKMTSNELGNELAIKINTHGKTVYVDTFNFNIMRNACDTITLRINVYALKDGLPDSNLLPTSVLVSTDSKHGWLFVDLKPYHLVINGDFAVGVEWIRESNCEPMSLLFSGSFFGTLYGRNTSQDNWVKLPIASPGFNVSVRY